MHIFIPRIIFAGLTSAESPRTSHRLYMLLFQLKEDTSSSAHYSALATLSPYYFEPVIRSKAEAGRNVDNKLYAEAANVPCPPCSTGLKSL